MSGGGGEWLRVLGVDPGPEKTALAWLSVARTTGIARCREAREVETRHLENVLTDGDNFDPVTGVGLIAVEDPVGHTGAGFNPQPLIDTARVAGRVLGLAYGIQIYSEWDGGVRAMVARAWRGTVLGLMSPSNAQVEIAIHDLIVDAPRHRGNHVLDACGVALAAAWAETGRRRLLSTYARTEIFKRQQQRQAKATAKARATKAARAAARVRS